MWGNMPMLYLGGLEAGKGPFQNDPGELGTYFVTTQVHGSKIHGSRLESDED